MGKLNNLFKMGSVLFFTFLLTGFIGYNENPVISFKYELLRTVRGVGFMNVRTSNYEVVDGPELENLRENFPSDPDKGRWLEAGTQNTYWLTLPEDCQGQLNTIKKFVARNSDKYDDVVTVGMGGSSRPTDIVSMFQDALDVSGPNIHVLETLDEGTISDLLSNLDLDTTLFVIISKSGSTAETIALSRLVSHEGGDFIAITTKVDEDGSQRNSKLMQFLKEQAVDLDEVQDHPEKVGGRYTFFSNIGILPAALAGINVDDLLNSARRAMESDIKYKLGQFMREMEEEGRTYMRIILPNRLAKFGLWMEQLVSESLGKRDQNGIERGIIAITERDFGSSVYERDDVFAVRIELGNEDEKEELIRDIEDVGTPLFELQLNSVEEVAGLIYNLEFATGMTGVLMGIDPFNQPDVDAKKQITRTMKADMREAIDGRVSSDKEENIFEVAKEEFAEIVSSHQTDYRTEISDGISLDFGDFVRVLETEHNIGFEDYMQERNLDINDAGDVYEAILTAGKEEAGKTYSALLPYNETYKDYSVWAKARGLMRRLGLVDVFGVGPVYEHSYSQFFHSGPNKGILTFITSTHPGEIKIPGDAVKGITFSMQNTLQALGAMQAETKNENPRLAVRIEINREFDEGVMSILEDFFESVSK